MSDDVDTSLLVTVRELPTIRVAYIDYEAKSGRGDFEEIHECFQRVQAWIKERGLDPFALLTIGDLQVVDGQLSCYACCVQVPEDVQSGSGGVGIKELPGGRYAVASIKKEPAVVGDSIRRFYQEYIPDHAIEIDDRRPTYEIYYKDTMEYCIPIHS